MTRDRNLMPDRLLTQREVAERLRVSVDTLRHWRYAGKLGMKVLRLGHRSLRIRESELRRFERRKEVSA